METEKPTAETATILPCPFCGAEPSPPRLYGTSQYVIGCDLCDLHLAPQETHEEALTAWNTRNGISK